MDNESSIAGVSVRAILVFTLIVVFSVSVFMGLKNDALNSLTMAAIGWYFGQKCTNCQQINNPFDKTSKTE